MQALHIYTEGGLSRGLGHLTRCLAYALAWRDLGGEVFWWVDGDEDVCSRLLLHETVSWDKWQVMSRLPQNGAFALVDSYSASFPVLSMIASGYEKVIFLDDTFRMQYPKGYVVHAAEGCHVPNEIKGSSSWLIGREWQALRPAFWPNFPTKKILRDSKNIFIMLGGTDHLNLTEVVCTEVSKQHPSSTLHVISNKLFNLENARFYNGLTDYEICNLMVKSDFSVTSASQCIFELAKVGTPGIILATAQNQDQQLKVWSGNGAFLSAGYWYKRKERKRLRQCINKIADFKVREYMSTVSKVSMSKINKPKALDFFY